MILTYEQNHIIKKNLSLFDSIEYFYNAGYKMKDIFDIVFGLYPSKLNIDMDDIQDEKEVFFWNVLNGIEFNFNNNDNNNDTIYWIKGDKILLHQDMKNRELYIHYNDIWRVFEGKYKMNHYEIQSFISNEMEKGIKLMGYTPLDMTLIVPMLM